MCAYVLRREQADASQARAGRAGSKRSSSASRMRYSRSLTAVLDHALLVGLLLIGLLVLNVFLFRLLPATFFPEQDTGILIGQIIADQSISFHGDGKEARATAGDRAERPGGGLGGRLHRRPRAQHRQRVHRTQAAGAAPPVRHRGGQPPASQAQCGLRRAAVPAGAAGPADRRPAVRRRISVHADQRRCERAVHLGAEARDRARQVPRRNWST